MIEKTNLFSQITKQMLETYERKNQDYGNSFDESLDKYGLIASIVRMSDKLNRLNSLKDKNNNEFKVNESIEDTLLDLANYAIMTNIWIKNKKNNDNRKRSLS